MTVGGVQAGTIQRQHFLDWDYAMHVWTTMKTREQGVAEWNRVVPAWEAWSEQHGEQMTEEALALIEKQPNARLIRQGHDLSLAYETWGTIYQSWLSGLESDRWNESRSFMKCTTIQMLNIFTNKCNDLPDWRHLDDRARDEARYENVQAGNAGREAYDAARAAAQNEGLDYRQSIARAKEARERAIQAYHEANGGSD